MIESHPKPASSRTAAGQYLGYTLQTVRALARLIEANEGDVVAIEKLDDVTLHKSTGYVIAEQVTSSISQKNALTNNSHKLWKTLYNWKEGLRAGDFGRNFTSYVLYFDGSGVPGTIASAFQSATSPDAAAAAIKGARKTLKWPPPSTRKKSSKRRFISSFLANRGGASAEVVAGFCIARPVADPIEDVRSSLEQRAVISRTASEKVVHALLGWIHDEAQRAIKENGCAEFEYSAFRARLKGLLRHYDRAGKLPSLSPKPAPARISEWVEDSTLARQLELIECPEEDIFQAASDFLWASAERTFWAVEGEVSKPALDAFQESLERKWRNARRKIALRDSAQPETKKGELLYLECMDYDAELDGRAVPEYFTPGSYHALADSLQIGWHPRYKHLLEGEEEK